MEKWVFTKYVPSTQPEARAPRASSPFLEVWHPGLMGSLEIAQLRAVPLPCSDFGTRAVGRLQRGLSSPHKAAALQVRLWSLALLELSCVAALSVSLWPRPADQLPAHTSDLPHCWGLACCWWDCLSLTAITTPESLTYIDLRPIPLLLTCPPIWTLLIPYPGLPCLSCSDPVGWGPGWWSPCSAPLFPLCVVALRFLSLREHLALAGPWWQSTVANTRKDHFHWLRSMVYMDENTVFRGIGSFFQSTCCPSRTRSRYNEKGKWATHLYQRGLSEVL